MNENAIKELWRSTNEKLEENILTNRFNAEAISKMKVHSLLKSMRPVKLFGLLAGIIWVVFVDYLIINSIHYASLFFLISAGIQVLITKVAIGIYLYQLFLIQKVDLSAPVLETQKKLTSLKSTTLLVVRILFLQLPVWTTFYLNGAMFQNGNMFLLVLQAVVTTAFVFAAAWLFFNIRYENKDRKWFRLIFSGKEWEPILKSMELNRELAEFKRMV